MSVWTLPLLACLLALAIGWAGAFLLARSRAGLDMPNERSLHERPTPRTGGLAIIAGILVGHLLLTVAGRSALTAVPLAVAAAVGLVLAVSLVDDLRGLPAALRMGVHVLAAALLLHAGLAVPLVSLPGLEWAPGPIGSAVFTTLVVVWLINLYNFMDGMDGFAGGMGAIGFAALAVMAVRGGDPALAASCLVVASACAGFLVVNFPPARIFMGDAGASVLGLLVAVVGLVADRRGVFPLWSTMLVFSPFIVDATVTLVRRAFAGERVWTPHRSHFYQRLVRLGWGHRRTTSWELALMILCAVSAVMAREATETWQGLTLAGWAIGYTLLMLGVTVLEKRGVGA